MTKTTTKTDWLIRRHGSNAANQPMTPAAAVGIVTDADEAAARRIAGEEINCYANQHLELVSYADCDSDEWNSVLERDADLREAGEDSIVFVGA